MTSPIRMAPVVPLDLFMDEESTNVLQAHHSVSNSSQSLSPTSLSLALESPEGIDCYGNERQVLVDQMKFYNNPTLSDITLVVGTDRFFAHKLILVCASDVFERMFSSEWNTVDGIKVTVSGE